MEGTPQTLTERRSAWGAAVSALQGAAGVLHQAQGTELAGLVTLLDELSAQAGAVRAVVVAEAVRRGEVDSTLVAWVRTQAPSLQQGGAAQLARIATEATKGGPIWSGGCMGVDPDSPMGIVWDAVTGADGGRASESDSAAEQHPQEDTSPAGDAAHGHGGDSHAGHDNGDNGLDDVGDGPDDVGDGRDDGPDGHDDGPDGHDDVADGHGRQGDGRGGSESAGPQGVFDDVPVITTCTAPISPGLGIAVLNEVRALTPRLRPEVVPSVTRVLVDLGRGWGAAHMRRFRAALLAEYGQPGELHDVQDKLAKAAYLSAPQVEETGLTNYRMALTPEQACTLEAAIGPQSKPAPNPETGQKDLRPAGQRRVEALMTVIRRAQAAASAGAGKDGAAGAWAALHVTIPLEDLRAATGCQPAPGPFGNILSTPVATPMPATDDLPTPPRAPGAGQVLLSRAQGVLLSPETIRRLACDADLVPVVLGTRGEILDHGQPARTAPPPLRRHLFLRDRHCTIPGCDIPAAWTRVHHVIHWLDRHTTDPDCTALLCDRHHTLVHEQRLWADVLPQPDHHGRSVIWDLTPGSYDQAITRLRATGDVPERDHLTNPMIWTHDEDHDADQELDISLHAHQASHDNHNNHSNDDRRDSRPSPARAPVVWLQEWDHDPDGPPLIWDDNAGTYISFPTHEPPYPVAG